MSAEYKPKSQKWLKELFGRHRAASLACSVCHAVDEYAETLPSLARLRVTYIL
jgi:hypothetical protein